MSLIDLSRSWLIDASHDFHSYIHRLRRDLHHLCSKGQISFWTVSFMSEMIDHANYWSNTLPILHHLTSRYYHSWNPREFKILSIADGRILSNDEYFWLRCYPGLNPRRSLNFAGDKYHFCDFQTPLISADDLTNTSTISHNGHFGHFLGDDLSRWIIFTCLGADIVPSLVGYRANLHMLLTELGLTSLPFTPELERKAGQLQQLLTSKTSFIQSNSVFDIASAPRVYTLFLAAYFLRQWTELSQNPIAKRGMVFLRRSGQYSTRIANISEFQSYLHRLGFDIVDPGPLSMSQLRTELSARSLIISESGTTTLLANLFAPRTAINIILLPDSLRNSPDHSMLLSGLPYMFFGYGTKQPFYGSIVRSEPIQTSSSVSYDINKLSLLLAPFLKC